MTIVSEYSKECTNKAVFIDGEPLECLITSCLDLRRLASFITKPNGDVVCTGDVFQYAHPTTHGFGSMHMGATCNLMGWFLRYPEDANPELNTLYIAYWPFVTKNDIGMWCPSGVAGDNGVVLFANDKTSKIMPTAPYILTAYGAKKANKESGARAHPFISKIQNLMHEVTTNHSKYGLSFEQITGPRMHYDGTHDPTGQSRWFPGILTNVQMAFDFKNRRPTYTLREKIAKINQSDSEIYAIVNCSGMAKETVFAPRSARVSGGVPPMIVD